MVHWANLFQEKTSISFPSVAELTRQNWVSFWFSENANERRWLARFRPMRCFILIPNSSLSHIEAKRFVSPSTRPILERPPFRQGYSHGSNVIQPPIGDWVNRYSSSFWWWQSIGCEKCNRYSNRRQIPFRMNKLSNFHISPWPHVTTIPLSTRLQFKRATPMKNDFFL